MIDDLEVDGTELVVAGHVTFGASLDPWGAPLAGPTPQAFVGRLDPEREPAPDDVVSFETIGTPSAAASDGSLIGARPSGPVELDGTRPASDLHLVRAPDRVLSFGDLAGTSVEVATDVVAEEGSDALLVTGWLTEDRTLAADVCDGACSGDLVDVDACAGGPVGADVDGFWLYLPQGGGVPEVAVGRSFGGCGKQRVVAGVLGPSDLTIVASVEGVATIDLLGGEAVITMPALRRGAVIARLPRP